MIRVLHFIGCFEMGGSQAMVMNLLRSLNRDEIIFDFVIDNTERNYHEAEARALGSKIFKMPKFNGKNSGQIKREWNKFFKDHPEYKILHSHVRSYASLYIPVAKKNGVKTIIHAHSTSNGKGIAALVKMIMQLPLRYQADFMLACSNESGKWLYGKKAQEKENYLFLPNAINVEKYQYSEKTATEYKRKLGLEGKYVIGHVGRFHEAKNHMFLLETFSKVVKARPDAVLLIVGDGDLKKSILDKVSQLEIDDKVILTGNRNDVPQLLQAMDLFVFPSLWEGLPLTVVEAQAASLPCVISDTITTDVDVSELVHRLPINDTDTWAEAILNNAWPKTNVIDKVKAAGFDVQDSISLLMKVYKTLGL